MKTHFYNALLPSMGPTGFKLVNSGVVGLAFIKGVRECLDFDYHWQCLVRLLFWAQQPQKRKLVIVDTNGTIATTHSEVAVIRDTHRDIISPGMSIPGK